MTSRPALNDRGRARPPARPRRRRQLSGQPVPRALVVVTLGVALILGLSLATPFPSLETEEPSLLQSVWSDPVPSFLRSGLAGPGSASDRRGLVPTEPPRSLGVPVAASRDAKASAGRGGIPIRVFFSRRPDSEASFSAVFPANRVAPDRGVATAALTSLIEGPNAAERANGYYSELGSALTGSSTCSGRDFQIGIANGTATVRFCRAISSAGVGQDARMRAQIETTLRQFPTIQTVRLIGSSGHCLFDGSGQDRCLGTPGASVPKPGRMAGPR